MAALLFDDITDGLKLVSCPFQPPDIGALKGMLGGKGCGKMYIKIIVWLCQQMPGAVEPISTPEAPDEEPLFRVELSTVLTELGCPVPGIGGADSLTDPNNRTAVLHYLIHELMATRITASNTTSTKQVTADKGCFSGHPALRDLAVIYSTLELHSPCSEDEIPDIFDTIINKINDISKKQSEAKDSLFSDPMLKFSLSPAQWQKFEEVCHVLNEEYTIRFKTLLKRLDLTLTSFKWSKIGKEKAETINKVYAVQRRLMKDTSNLGIAEVLAARADLACVPKTSSGSVRDNTRTKLNKMVIVGKVPDRGGRPMEQRPEPEIPSWLKDKNKGGGKHYQQSRGGMSQAAGGNRYQQQNDRNRQQNHGYHQNRGYHDRQNQGQGQQQHQGYQQNQGQGYQQNQNQGYQQNQNQGYQQNQGSYRRGNNTRGNRGGSWGGYRGGGSNRGGIY